MDFHEDASDLLEQDSGRYFILQTKPHGSVTSINWSTEGSTEEACRFDLADELILCAELLRNGEKKAYNLM